MPNSRVLHLTLSIVVVTFICSTTAQSSAQTFSSESESSSTSGQTQQPPCDQICDRLPGASHIQVEYGTPRPVIDGAGWVLGIPRKVLQWDRRALNHAVSDTTVTEVASYLQHNQLEDTVVRVNQYAPRKEWQRLVSNCSISPGWRYTVGSLKWLKYTFIPGRLFGQDEYNPYTNSLSIYSDMPMLGLAEAAYAKDVHSRTHPGTYAAVQELPLVALWHETLATNEVFNYVSIHGSTEQIQKVRHDLYARYGLETAGVVSQVLPDGSSLFAIVGAVSGHTMAAIENRSWYR